MEVGKRKKRRLKAQDERRESLVKVLLTEEQKRQFTARAEAVGMTISTWFRTLAIREVAIARPKPAKSDDREGGDK